MRQCTSFAVPQVFAGLPVAKFPARVEPFTADPLDQEEYRQKLIARRKERFDGVCAGYEQRGDELLEFVTVVELLTEAPSDLTPARLTRRFTLSVQLGHFPKLGAGFCRGPEGRAVRGLIDLNLGRVAPGQYSFRPSVVVVEAAPLRMRAPRSTWVAWIGSQDWPVPAMLRHGLVIDHRSAVLPGEAGTAAENESPAGRRDQVDDAPPPEPPPPTREEAIRLQLQADGLRKGQSIPEQTFGRAVRARCKIAHAIAPKGNPPRGWGDKYLARLARNML
jgi:hypothetical protein